MTVADALDRLATRRKQLVADRDRIQASRDSELKKVNAQIAAIDSVNIGLSDAKQATAIDSLFTALGVAGVVLNFD